MPDKVFFVLMMIMLSSASRMMSILKLIWTMRRAQDVDDEHSEDHV